MESRADHPNCMGPPRAVAGWDLVSEDVKLPTGDDDVDSSGDVAGHLAVSIVFEPEPRLAWRFDVSDDAPGTARPSALPGDLVWAAASADRDLPLLVVTRRDFSGEDGSGVELSGIIDLNSLSAPSTDCVEEIRFDVINLDAPYGTLAVADASSTRAARHEWELEGWRVLLDGQPDVNWRQMSAGAEFGVTHVGSLMRADGSSFSYADGHGLLECLHWFLSFVQGRRVGIALPFGYAKAGDADRGIDPVADRWTIFVTDAAGSGVQGWYPSRPPVPGPHGLAALAEAFHAAWNTDPDQQQRIMFLISVLCTATAQTILVEPRLVMAFVGLEALVGENIPARRKVNMNKDLEKALQASGVPTTMTYLQNPRGSEPVNHLIQERNAIVHLNKPIKDTTWNRPAHIVHAWKVALWMLQRLLLRRFDYDGHCYNHMNHEIEKLPLPHEPRVPQ